MNEVCIKNKIINETKKCLKKHRTMNFSLNEVLQNANISKGSFYYYFKSKDELIYQTIAPFMREHEKRMRGEILKQKTLKNRLYVMYDIFLNEELSKELENLEKMYKYLFFDSKVNKSQALKKLYVEGRKVRKILILESIKCEKNIKITREIKLFSEYLIDTIMFYTILNRTLFDKVPRKEIVCLIDTFCSMIESKSQTRSKNERAKNRL